MPVRPWHRRRSPVLPGEIRYRERGAGPCWQTRLLPQSPRVDPQGPRPADREPGAMQAPAPSKAPVLHASAVHTSATLPRRREGTVTEHRRVRRLSLRLIIKVTLLPHEGSVPKQTSRNISESCCAWGGAEVGSVHSEGPSKAGLRAGPAHTRGRESRS